MWQILPGKTYLTSTYIKTPLRCVCIIKCYFIVICIVLLINTSIFITTRIVVHVPCSPQPLTIPSPIVINTATLITQTLILHQNTGLLLLYPALSLYPILFNGSRTLLHCYFPPTNLRKYYLNRVFTKDFHIVLCTRTSGTLFVILISFIFIFDILV